MSLTFKEYSDFARLSDLYPRVTGVDCQILPVYPALAMQGESAELAEKLLGPPRPQIDYLHEVGDVLWYVDAAARDLGLELEQVSACPDFKGWQARVNSVEASDMYRHALWLHVYMGRVSERIKKSWRDKGSLHVAHCVHDLHSVLCAAHQVATCVYGTLEDAARANMAKLESRRARGVVSGSGDNR